jgi:hypothetical protein
LAPIFAIFSSLPCSFFIPLVFLPLSPILSHSLPRILLSNLSHSRIS